MSLFDDYAPYREPIHEREQARLDEAAKKRGNGPIKQAVYLWNNQVVMEDPVLNAHVNIAYDRTAWDLQQIRMPTTPNLDRKFPGIDPEGMHCDVDMDIAQRIARLQGAASACRDNNKMVLDSFLNNYTQSTGRIGALAVAVKKTCKDIQITEHAAKVCLDKTASLALEKAATYIQKNDPGIQKLDQILTAMEQVAGLRSGKLDPDTIDMYRQMNPRMPLHPELTTGLAAKRHAPETFDVNFQNFDNIARQNYYANPSNWGFRANPQIPKEPTDSLALAACMRRYAGGTTSNALTSLFGPTELNEQKSPIGAHRATLVIVDGKTVSERMQEIYNGLPDSRPGFEEWCAEHLKEKLIDKDAKRTALRDDNDMNFNAHAYEEKFNQLETRMKNIYNGLGDISNKPRYEEWRTDNMWKLFKTVADPEMLQTMERTMKEDYQNAPKKTPYSQWYAENLDRMSSEIVASGLMSGKRVEAYVPDPDGKLPDQPTVLHKTGYEPTPEKPVTLNAWERFFNKFGFYKEKAAQAKEHSELLAARERLKANYVAARNQRLGSPSGVMKEMFFGDYLRRNNIPSMTELDSMTAPGSHFRLGRGAATTACVCMLAADGHDIRDIMDPTKLQTQKRAAAEEYMRNAFMDPATGQPGVDRDHRLGNDRWLGDVMFRGQMELRRQINNIMAETDLNDPINRQMVIPVLGAATGVMFDGFQEAVHNADRSQVYVGYLRAAHQEAARTNDPAGGDTLAHDLMQDINKIAFFFRRIDKAELARAKLTSPYLHPNDVHSAVTALITENAMLKMVNPSTDLPFTQRIPSENAAGDVDRQIIQNDDYIPAVARSMANRRANWKADADMILSGEFANSFNVDVQLGTRTWTESKDYLRTAPDGTLYVQRGTQPKVLDTATASISIAPSMAQKLGIRIQPANQAAPTR